MGFLVFKDMIPENAKRLKDCSVEFVKCVKSGNIPNAQYISNEASNILMNLLVSIRKAQDNCEFGDFDLCVDKSAYYMTNVRNEDVEGIWSNFKNNPHLINNNFCSRLSIRRFANINAHGDFVGYFIDGNHDHWLCFKNEQRNGTMELIVVNVQKTCDVIIENLQIESLQ